MKINKYIILTLCKKDITDNVVPGVCKISNRFKSYTIKEYYYLHSQLYITRRLGKVCAACLELQLNSANVDSSDVLEMSAVRLSSQLRRK